MSVRSAVRLGAVFGARPGAGLWPGLYRLCRAALRQRFTGGATRGRLLAHGCRWRRLSGGGVAGHHGDYGARGGCNRHGYGIVCGGVVLVGKTAQRRRASRSDRRWRSHPVCADPALCTVADRPLVLAQQPQHDLSILARRPCAGLCHGGCAGEPGLLCTSCRKLQMSA